jgi:23S rRNA (cytosine1962-C5)-methyltransferase
MPAEIRLLPGRERALLRHHPWIFSGAVAQVNGNPTPGETVEVLSAEGGWLARAAFSPASQIRARVWTRDPSEVIDGAFFERRIRQSLTGREDLRSDEHTTAYREVHAESDGVPGVIVDRYGDVRVMQLLTAGAERHRESILDVLRSGCAAIVERSDASVRGLEGLPERTGTVWGNDPGNDLLILEHGLRYHVDVHHGHKTGFYLDQRENRQLMRIGMEGRDILNCFAYTGGFTVCALTGGAASVLSIDTSASSLEMARANVCLNALDESRCEWMEADVFEALRGFRDRRRSFDAIVLDPPRFAATTAQVDRAARAYKDINLMAFRLLRKAGTLFTFSCSGGVSLELFQKIVADAALDAGVQAVVVGWLGQPADHPVDLAFPEGRYLKGLVVRVTGATAH